MKIKVKIASLMVFFSVACLLGNRFGVLAATSNVEIENSSMSNVVTLDSAIKDFEQMLLDNDNRVLRVDGSKTDDLLEIHCGNLFEDCVHEQVPCGMFLDLGKKAFDRNVHICLFAANENSAFVDDNLNNLLLEVVCDDDGSVVFEKPCKLEEINDNVYSDWRSDAFSSHLADSAKKGGCFCNEFALKAMDIIKNKYSRQLKFILSDDEVKQGEKLNPISVEKFLTTKDLELLNEGEKDVSKFGKSNGKTYTLNFYKVNGNDKNLVAKAGYKFKIF